MPPSFSDNRYRTDLTVVQGKSIKLVCNPSGIPEPTIIWLKSGHVLDLKNRRKVRTIRGGQSIVLTSMSVNDTAVYTCLASNEAGDSRKEFRVDVLGT